MRIIAKTTSLLFEVSIYFGIGKMIADMYKASIKAIHWCMNMINLKHRIQNST